MCGGGSYNWTSGRNAWRSADDRLALVQRERAAVALPGALRAPLEPVQVAQQGRPLVGRWAASERPPLAAVRRARAGRNRPRGLVAGPAVPASNLTPTPARRRRGGGGGAGGGGG